MNYRHKSEIKITGFLPAIFSVAIFLLSTVVWGVAIGFYTLGIIVFIYGALMYYAYLRTKNKWNILSTIYMLCYSGVFITLAPHMNLGGKIYVPVYTKVLITLTLLMLIWLLYLNANRKLKWRGKDILELAAQQVYETEGVYTGRPRATGTVAMSKLQLLDFAEYFEKNLLGLAYREADRVVYMPLKYKNEYFALYNPKYDYSSKTWVAISHDGNVSVHMSKSDYFDYKEDLAFDQLCKALSDVMLEFLYLHNTGAEVRIIDNLDELKINIFT